MSPVCSLWFFSLSIQVGGASRGLPSKLYWRKVYYLLPFCEESRIRCLIRCWSSRNSQWQFMLVVSTHDVLYIVNSSDCCKMKSEFLNASISGMIMDFYRYTLFWILVLATKFSFSYFLQVFEPFPHEFLNAFRSIFCFSWRGA